MKSRQLAPVLLLALAATGCTTPAAGTPQADTAPPFAAAPLPHRPRSLPVGDVDLCALLTTQDRTDLSLFPGRPGMSSELDTANATALCGWDHLDGAADDAYTVSADVHHSTASRLAITPESHIVDIAGFGAFEHTRFDSMPATSCQVEVDVAPDQTLLMRYGFFGPVGASTHEQACRKARTVMTVIVTNLSAQKGP